MPQQLCDDTTLVHAGFSIAANNVTPEEVQDLIQMSFPRAHHVEDFPRIAKYPVVTWEMMGSPCLSVKSWCKLALKIAKHDFTKLEKAFGIAKTIDAKLPAEAASNANSCVAVLSWGIRATTFRTHQSRE